MTLFPEPKHIMILAGEPSGDFHGEHLLKALKRRIPEIKVSGIGGSGLQHAGMELIFHIDKLSVMGVLEVLLQFKTIKTAFSRFRKELLEKKPALLILIDYPGFNLKAAAFAKKIGVPVLYYITPKVWAWNRARLETIRKVVDHAAIILPFEVPLYAKEKIPFTFVGHPLLDIYPEPAIENSHDNDFVIGLLPGSRQTEIDLLLEPLLKAAHMIKKKLNTASFLVSAAPSVNFHRLSKLVDAHNLNAVFTVVPGGPELIFSKADFIIAASGTVTLEAAICGIPNMIVYKMNPVTYALAKRLVKVKYAGLANLIADAEIVPELIQEKASAKNIAAKALSLLNRDTLAKMRTRLLIIRRLLGRQGASERTATIALKMIKTE